MTKTQLQAWAIIGPIITGALGIFSTYQIKQRELDIQEKEFASARKSLEKERDRCWTVVNAALSEGCKLKLAVPKEEVTKIQNFLPPQEFKFEKRQLPSGDYELMIFKKN